MTKVIGVLVVQLSVIRLMELKAKNVIKDITVLLEQLQSWVVYQVVINPIQVKVVASLVLQVIYVIRLVWLHRIHVKQDIIVVVEQVLQHHVLLVLIQ